MNQMFVKSTHFKQVCQLLLSLIVGVRIIYPYLYMETVYLKVSNSVIPANRARLVVM